MATKKTATPKAETAPKAATKTVTPKVETAPKVTAETAPKATTKKAAASKSTNQVTFSLPKEAVATAKKVTVVGDFNNWDINGGVELKKQKDGSFKTTFELEAGKEYQYRFLLNGEVWANAWDAPKYVPTPFGVDNSVVIA